MLENEDEITRFFQFNETKTSVTLIICAATPMTFHQYLEILNDFVHEADLTGEDLFGDTSFLEEMN